MILPLLVLVAGNTLGAYLAVRIRAGLPPWWAYGPAMVNASVWITLACGTVPLPQASVLFDVVGNTTCLLVMVSLGERLTTLQAVGASLALTGLGLMSYRPA